MQENQGKAAAKRALQEAEQTRTHARAEGDRIRIIGEGEAAKTVALAAAEAERIGKVGAATAETIEKQVAASGGAQFQLTRQIVERVAEALERSGVDIVPRVQISAGEGGAQGGTLVDALMGLVLADKGMASLTGAAAEEKRPVPRIAAE